MSIESLKKGRGDAGVIERIRSGDETALAEIYDRYSGVVYSVALRVLGDTGLAEDVLQDIFLQLWRNPQSFDSNRGDLAPWLAVIARHRSIDYLRKRRPQINIEDIVIGINPKLQSTAELSQAVSKIKNVLEKLPAEQRLAVELAFFEELTHVEIAARTGEPLGTIKTRIRTALLALREALVV